jgi:hypothetical protein
MKMTGLVPWETPISGLAYNPRGVLIQQMIMPWKSLVLLATCVPLAAPAAKPFPVERITASVSVVRGPVNGVLIQRNREALAVYGDPRPEPGKARQVLFTHHRRDVVWAGRLLVERGAEAVAPDAEKALFTDVGQFWERYRTARFHDYANQSSRILAEPIPLAKTVRGNDLIHWQDLTIRVVETPGYTRGAVSYLVEIDGKRIAPCCRRNATSSFRSNAPDTGGLRIDSPFPLFLLQSIQRMRLPFNAPGVARTQKFTVRWGRYSGGHACSLVLAPRCVLQSAIHAICGIKLCWR